MHKRMVSLAVALIAAVIPLLPNQESSITPPIPITHAAEMAAAFPQPNTTLPQELSIPSIGLAAPIIPVGVNAKGEMDVPPGSTQEVGWYADGTVPGAPGSAVIDAHVFAAFASLHNIRIGDDVYVFTNAGTKLHFKVTAMRTYPLAEVSAEALFNASGARQLNLITCAGKYIPSQQTYDHRLVVFTTLVD